MDKMLQYMMKNIELEYYMKNPDIFKYRITCLKNEGLPCNCFTGIMLNYAEYVACQCFKFKSEKYEAEFVEEDNIEYLRVLYNNKKIVPVIITREFEKTYIIEDVLCDKKYSYGNQAYVRFDKYDKLENLVNEINNLHEELYNECPPVKGSNFIIFWFHFLNLIRTKPIEESSVAFLAMALFSFPISVLKLINKKVREKSISPERLVGFICNYLDFLENCGDPNATEFLQKFSFAFKTFTGISIVSYFEEELEKGETEPLEVLVATHKDNLRVMHLKRRNLYRLITNAINEMPERNGVKLAKKLKEKLSESQKITKKWRESIED